MLALQLKSASICEQNSDVPCLAVLVAGSQHKRAVVQWFCRLAEIPQGKRKLLKREISAQEVFFDQILGYDTDIAAETIIKRIMVCTATLLHREGRKKQQQPCGVNQKLKDCMSCSNKICE